MTPENMAEIRKWFSEYCRSFYSDYEDFQRNISLKEDHTFRVCSNILEIGRGESLDEDGLGIAEAVSLLHDVGRFEQYRQYGTFRDADSVNHAELGAQILEDYEVLSPLFPRERTIIAHAVEFHNAFAIPKTLTEEARFFLKMIRDADKLDIWRVFIDYFNKPEQERASAAGLGLPDKPRCSAVVLKQISDRKMVRLSTVKTLNDFKIMQLSWIFDLNFSTSFRLIKDRNCIDGLASTLPADDRVAIVVGLVRDYVNAKIQTEGTSPPVFLQP
ncbi:MAG TPA: HD domain-containing protein [Geobacteraceae bacterium]|nr:HD domain-containing protein [Geobacteraceae bacterium]